MHLKALSVLGFCPALPNTRLPACLHPGHFLLLESNRPQSAIAGSKTSASLLFISSWATSFDCSNPSSSSAICANCFCSLATISVNSNLGGQGTVSEERISRLIFFCAVAGANRSRDACATSINERTNQFNSRLASMPLNPTTLSGKQASKLRRPIETSQLPRPYRSSIQECVNLRNQSPLQLKRLIRVF